MGTATSRGKKVAPACVSEVNVTKTGSKLASSTQDSNSFKPLKVHSILRSTRIRAQPDCHSEGHDSELSGEDEDFHRELDTALADYEEIKKAPVKKTSQKKTFKSKTYGLCHFSQEDTEGEESCAARPRAEEPRVLHSVPKDVNRKSNSAFIHLRQRTFESSNQDKSFSQSDLTRRTSLDVVSTSEKQPVLSTSFSITHRSCGSCQTSSVATPLILYDGSEEELMDTIEREFS